jgi:hypothetical protein
MTEDPAAEIDAKIAALGDWRGATLGTLRALIRQAIPDIEESIKWRKPGNPAGVPVWSVVDAAGKARILCTGEVYKDKIKLTFMDGAKLPDPTGVFNASLDGGTRRAIDLREGEMVDEAAFVGLVGIVRPRSKGQAEVPYQVPDINCQTML